MGSKEAPPAPPPEMLLGDELSGRRAPDPCLYGRDLHGVASEGDGRMNPWVEMEVLREMIYLVDTMAAGVVRTVRLQFHYME